MTPSPAPLRPVDLRPFGFLTYAGRRPAAGRSATAGRSAAVRRAAAGVVEALEGRTLLSATASATSAATSFRPPESHAVPNAATLLATGDFNDDGADDLVAAGPDGVSVLLSDGAGGLGAAKPIGGGSGTADSGNVGGAAAGRPAAAVVVGDFTDDGEDDVLVVAPTGSIAVLPGRGDGTFRSAVATPARRGPVASAAAGDFDDDGLLDLAVAGPSGVAVLFGRGDGSFGSAVVLAAGTGSPAAGSSAATGSYSAVAVGDLSGDYTDDVAAAGPAGVRVFASHDDRTFAAGIAVTTGIAAPTEAADSATSPASTAPIGLAIDDFNYDGLGDLAVTDAAGGSVRVLLGRSADEDGGGDDNGLVVPVENPPLPVPVATPGAVDGSTTGGGGASNGGSAGGGSSGDDDSGGWDDGSTPYAGLFATPIVLTVGGTPTLLAVGDVNGDYSDDLVVADAAGHRLAVFLANPEENGTFATDPTTVDLGAAAAQPAAALVADVTGDGLADLVAGGGRAVTVVPQASADVGVTVDAPALATIGADYTYTLTVTNHGPAAASGVSVYQSLPSGLTFVSATGGTFVTVDPVPDYLGPDGSIDASAGPADPPSGVTVGVGDLADGASVVLRVTVRPIRYQSVYAYAYVQSQSADAGYDNDYANAQTRVVGATGSEVELTQSTNGGWAYPGPIFAADGSATTVASNSATAATAGSAPTAGVSSDALLPIRWWGGGYARVGQDLVYTLTLTNHGPDSATGLRLVDTLPAGVTFVSATSSQGTTHTSTVGTVTAAVGDLPVGGSATVTITVKPTAAGPIANAATVTLADSSADPFADNNASTLSTTVYDGTISYPIPYVWDLSDTAGGGLTPAAGGTGNAGGTGTASGTPTATPTTAASVRAAAAAASQVSVADATVVEGNAGTTSDLVFTVTRTGDPSAAATVKFATSAGTAKSGTGKSDGAKAGRDFLSRRGTLTFRPNVTSLRVTVHVKEDAKAEPDETLSLDLSDAVGTTISAGHATGTIANDDAKPGNGTGGKTAKTKVAIDFTTAAAGAAKGYSADVGTVFGPQPDGQSYGWSVDNAASAVEAAAGKSGPLRTYNVLGTAGTTVADTWEIALPNGKYKVRLSAGDPDRVGEAHAVTAEGVAFLAGTTTAKHKFVEAKGTIEVTDGRLTLTAADGTLAKLAAIKVRAV